MRAEWGCECAVRGKVIKNKNDNVFKGSVVYGHIWEHGYPAGRFNPEVGVHF